MESIEKHLNLEKKEELQPKIELSFLRHSIKEEDIEKSQKEIMLTSEGKKLAAEKYKERVDFDQSVAFGTSYKRTQETAAFVLGGAKDIMNIGGYLEEIKDKLDTGLKVRSKIGIDKRLLSEEGLLSEYGEQTWNQNPSIKEWKKLLEEQSDKVLSPYGLKMFERIKDIGFLRFLVSESDDLVKQFGDENGMSYSRKAKDVAEIVEKYLTVLPRWEKLVLDESKNYKPNLQRYFISHQGTLECFLLKVIEKLKGTELRNKLVDLLGNQGFDYAEGFQLDIDKSGILIKYKNDKDKNDPFILEEKISQQIIDEIIN